MGFIEQLGVVGIIGAVILILAIAKKFPKKYALLWGILGGVGVVAGLGISGTISFAGVLPLAVTPAAVADQYEGDTSTLYINAYDKEADSLTEAYPSYFILSDSGRLVDGVNANSTNTVVGAELKIYVDSDTTSYGDSPTIINGVASETYTVTDRAPTITIDVHSVASEASMAVTAYDDTMTALTAADETTNCDGDLTLGASGEKVVYIKIENAQANKLFKLGAICTGVYNSTGMDSWKIHSSEAWTETSLWKEIRTTKASLNASGPAEEYFRYCWVPSAGYIDLHEWDSVTIKTTVKAGSVDPKNDGAQAKTMNTAFLQIFDIGHAKAADGSIKFLPYVDDDNGRHSEVGVAEDETTPQGKTSGFQIEID